MAATALAATALAACAGILGLDEFSKGECAGARCGDAGDLPDAPVDTGTDVVVDARTDAPPGTDPVSWARWPMPNYTVDGGPFLPRPLNYTIGADGVTDTVTGLTWRRALLATPSTDFSLEQAKLECKKLGPWRVPKRIELVTLLDYGRSGPPFLDSAAFPQFPPVSVWSSSEFRELDVSNPATTKPVTKYWTVDFKAGVVEGVDAATPLRVLCVKGT